ncbi:hypothetical protein LZG04_11050 [Saccharothrix sp. S26]|uniref:hypothetical protein n=1 Tax=Saccharothrix sp. S26 TaxID=2907215 RepID=UPI001F350CFD|nr:hypothetical protein [Saccharothrix sp. S26]MCE6995343.1 hypothetical protein [Saccharothrix sp. S26]
MTKLRQRALGLVFAIVAISTSTAAVATATVVPGSRPGSAHDGNGSPRATDIWADVYFDNTYHAEDVRALYVKFTHTYKPTKEFGEKTVKSGEKVFLFRVDTRVGDWRHDYWYMSGWISRWKFETKTNFYCDLKESDHKGEVVLSITNGPAFKVAPPVSSSCKTALYGR